VKPVAFAGSFVYDARPMRIGLITWGTEGDVRPFFALAQALTQRGHTVELAYVSVEDRSFEALSASCGVTATAIGGDYFRDNRARLHECAARSLESASPPAQFELILRDLMDPVADEILQHALALAARCDVLVGHILVHPVATAAAKAGVPYVAVALQPVFRSKHYPPAGAGDLGRVFNPLLWKIADWVMRRALSPRIAVQREALGLAPERFDASRAGPRRPVLLAVSPSLFVRPDDWSEHIAMTGFLTLAAEESAWRPDAALGAFLDRGAPVFASFGSMFSLNDDLARTSVRVFVDAARRAGVRVVVQCARPIAEGIDPGDDVFFIERAPHGALFPRCSLIVHHGGAGTTQSALRAGRASVVVPHAADQFYWGDALYARGVAAKPLLRTRLDAKALAARIRWALDRPALTARAEELARDIAREDGLAQTVAAIEALGAKPA
jgi:UDP:flavonoid glycosyltransferase YjiC (YdhE family)